MSSGCACARCALDKSRGGAGLLEHAEKPKKVSGAATPTSSKFAALQAAYVALLRKKE